MTREQTRTLIAQAYVAMAEIDHDLREWREEVLIAQWQRDVAQQVIDLRPTGLAVQAPRTYGPSTVRWAHAPGGMATPATT